MGGDVDAVSRSARLAIACAFGIALSYLTRRRHGHRQARLLSSPGTPPGVRTHKEYRVQSVDRARPIKSNGRDSHSGSLLALAGTGVGTLLFFSLSPLAPNVPRLLTVIFLACLGGLHIGLMVCLLGYARTPSSSTPPYARWANDTIERSGGPWLVALILGWQNVILFAAVYLEVEAGGTGDAFVERLNGRTDGFYFSVITLFTIGYGDIRPVATVARVVVTMQVILGFAVLALLGDSVSRTSSDGD